MSETTATDVQADAPAQKPNTVNWWELQVTDLEEAKKFYGAVFGWTFQSFGEGFEVICTPDGTMIGGLDSATGKSESPAGRGTRVYVMVEDLEDTLSRVEPAGGKVQQSRTMIAPEYGWFGLLTDPSGLTVGLTTSNEPR
jgi:uncharacterized protein